MTPQEIFDRVSEHLLKQGRAALNSSAANPSQKCAYRAPNGDRCAIGCLIPDDRYGAGLEGRPGTDHAVMAAAGFEDAPIEVETLFFSLQTAHDRYLANEGVEAWACAMLDIAERQGLTPSPALTEAAAL